MHRSKVCFKCNEEKPLGEFYRHSGMADGRLNKCKKCTQIDVRANREKKAAYYREYDKNRANLPKRVNARAEYAKTYRGDGRAKVMYRTRYPLRYEAHKKVGNALRDGRLTRQKCEVCGSLRAQAHHADYRKPLDVMWLCRKHHVEWHLHNEALPHSDDARRRIADAKVIDVQKSSLSRSVTPWSEDDVEMMTKMKRDGENDADVAARLGRTINSVKTKYRRLSRLPF